MSELAIHPLSPGPGAAPQVPPPPAPPAPRGVGWIDLATAAARAGVCEGSLRHRLKQWISTGLARLERPGGGGGKSRWFVREDADPRFARVKPVEVLDSEFDVRVLTDSQRGELRRRQRITDDWLLARAAAVRDGRTEQQATAEYLRQLEDRGESVSRGTLFNWLAGYKQEGLRGLADKRWLVRSPDSRNHASNHAITYHDFYDELKRLWLDPRQRSARFCYDHAVLLAEEPGKNWPVPGERTARRFLSKIPRKTADLHRLGERKYDSIAGPFIERDYTRIRCPLSGEIRPMHSNDVWCADHHQFDCWVLPPGSPVTSKPVRPWICGWQDARSRKVLGWKIVPQSPDTSTIIAALRDALRECGAPLIAYTDNGKDFDSYAMQGVTKRQRRQRRALSGGPQDRGFPARSGIFGLLRVEVRHAREFNAKAKQIERVFRPLSERFSKIWPTYCGNSPQARPQDLDLSKAPTWDEFIASFSDWIEVDHNAKDGHRGHGMDGLSPAAVYARELVEKRAVDDRLLDTLTLRRSRPLKVGRNGVSYMGHTYGRSSPELADRTGQEVVLAVDDRDLRTAQVYTAGENGGKLICIARVNERVPWFDHEAGKSVLAEIKADKRARREYLDRRPRMSDSPADRLYRKAAAAREARRSNGSQDLGEGGVDLPNAGTKTAPPVLRPVRTPLDDQLPAIQAAVEGQGMKLAVGAESMSPPARVGRFEYTPAQRLDEDEPAGAGGGAGGFIYHAEDQS